MAGSKNRKILLIADKPSHYRVDLYNRMVKTFSNISFYFVMDPRFKERNIISVFEGEPFHKNSKFLKSQKALARGMHFLIDIIKENPDIIINISMSLRMIFLIIYSKLFGKKLVIWWGGTQDSERNIAKYKLIYRKIITHLSDGYILYSKLAEEYLRSLNRNIRKVLILGNNTFDSSRYYEQIMNLQSVRKKGSKLTIMTVGFLIPRKNIMTLLEAYAKLKKAFRNIRLIIIGNGPELSKLKAYCLEHKLEEVDFKGFIPHKEMLLQYAEADIYVHPALFDQWPQTYNEAASSGLPIVISRSSGVHNEYIEQYKDNVLFDSTDETQLERKLSKVIANDALRKELGDKALEDALKNDCKTASEKVKRFLFSFE